MLQRVSDQVAECLLRAAEAEERAARSALPATKAEYERMAESWRNLARSYEFQGSLSRFISFNRARRTALLLTEAGDSSTRPTFAPEPQDRSKDKRADLLDRLASAIARTRPYSAKALLLAVASLAIATVLRFMAGWASSDLRFAIYLPAILATGLLAGVPAALCVSLASLFIVAWAFIPPFFAFKWFTTNQELNLLFNALPDFITVWFAHCCRIVLLRLHDREIINKVLTRELEHRSKNVFSVVGAIVRKTLGDQPERSASIIRRLDAMRRANDVLIGRNSQAINIKTLLTQEFAPYGVDRLDAYGPELAIEPENARHVVLLFHELTTNAAKYGPLSCADGRVSVAWQYRDGGVYLTWREIGGPPITRWNSGGFGSQLIDLCVQSLFGTIQKRFESAGFFCSMLFPATVFRILQSSAPGCE
jgi:two-component sensor histidine kinase